MFEKLVVLFNISFFASFEKKNFEYLQRIRSNGVSCIIQTSKLFKLRHHHRFMLIKQVSYDIYVPVCGNDIARECEFIQKYNGWENYRTWDISRADIWIISRFFFNSFLKILQIILVARWIIALRSIMRVHSPRLYPSPFLKGKNRTSAWPNRSD